MPQGGVGCLRGQMREQNRSGRGRRAHLGDFVRGEGGRFVYRGVTYRFVGDARERRRQYASLALFSSLSLAATLAAGCIPSAGMDDCFYVLIPWVLCLTAGLFLFVAAARLLFSGDPIRAYVYEKSAVLLKTRGMISAISALPCLLAVALYLILNGFEGKVFATLAYFLLLSLSALLSFLLFRLSGTLRYEKQLPPSLDEKD